MIGETIIDVIAGEDPAIDGVLVLKMLSGKIFRIRGNDIGFLGVRETQEFTKRDEAFRAAEEDQLRLALERLGE